jgi:AmmeMemoRadiSam system protein A
MMTYDLEQRKTILSVARQAAAAALRGQRVLTPTVPMEQAWLLEPRGCFVSLYRGPKILRGCIGRFTTEQPLIDTVAEMAVEATRDSRFFFDPVSLAELPHLTIEVSVLTPMRRLADPLAMRVGVDGLYLRSADGKRSGCFLPQVASEQGWDARQTLQQCCTQKMGLAADAWSATDGSMECYVFQAEVISESELA